MFARKQVRFSNLSDCATSTGEHYRRVKSHLGAQVSTESDASLKSMNGDPNDV